MAAAGLSTLLVSIATPPMFVVRRLAKIMAVCLRALAESKAFMVGCETLGILLSVLAQLSSVFNYVAWHQQVCWTWAAAPPPHPRPRG